MTETTTNVLVRIEPCLVGIEDAASMLGISVTALKTLDRCGQLGPMPVQIGMCRRRLYSVAELRAWVEAGCPNREKWQVIKDEKNF